MASVFPELQLALGSISACVGHVLFERHQDDISDFVCVAALDEEGTNEDHRLRVDI